MSGRVRELDDAGGSSLFLEEKELKESSKRLDTSRSKSKRDAWSRRPTAAADWARVPPRSGLGR